MPAEKITHSGGSRKGSEHNVRGSMEQANTIADDSSSTTMVPHTNTDSNPGNSVVDQDNKTECIYCSENAESESGQRSCQHWTQVRSFNNRQAQKKKLRGLQNGHPEPSRYSNSRNTKENMNMQRHIANSNSADGLSLRDAAESNAPNTASSRFKCDRPLPSNNRNMSQSNTEPTKSVASNSSSPVPSVSSDLPNGHEYGDNRTFPRYPHKSSRSFRSVNQSVDAEDINSPRSNNSPVTTGGANMRNRPNMNRSSVNMPPQSGPATNAHQNGPCDQWRRPSNNGSWRRSHHTLPFAPRNSNQFHRYNGPGNHPVRPHQNNFSRNRISGPGMGDSPPTQTGDSPNHASNESNPQPDNKKQENVKKPQTSWAAAVAVGVQSEEKLGTPGDNSRIQLVNFLLDQWRCFDRKSS
ncbi:unnamed protein product [Trichobilharzia szidati]|nr:unnamed protein product [Trichobilharzia szidati]